MSLPPLVFLGTAVEYRERYTQLYCRGEIYTHDGIRVYFSPLRFDHCFYESSLRDGAKDVFSTVRAQRIDWIKSTLEHPGAELFMGWNAQRKDYDGTRRVAVVYQEFVVVIAISQSQAGLLKANFVTCYLADNSIAKIRQSPRWSRDECIRLLRRGEPRLDEQEKGR